MLSAADVIAHVNALIRDSAVPDFNPVRAELTADMVVHTLMIALLRYIITHISYHLKFL